MLPTKRMVSVIIENFAAVPQQQMLMWGWRLTLLEVTRDGISGIEFATTFLLDAVGNEFRGVDLACLLVAEDDLASPDVAGILGELVLQELDIFDEHVEVNALFWCVDSHGADSESSDGSDVPRRT